MPLGRDRHAGASRARSGEGSEQGNVVLIVPLLACQADPVPLWRDGALAGQIPTFVRRHGLVAYAP
jgi:hypothetical protein